MSLLIDLETLFRKKNDELIAAIAAIANDATVKFFQRREPRSIHTPNAATNDARRLALAIAATLLSPVSPIHQPNDAETKQTVAVNAATFLL